eukprot:m.15635 g.15635  ORF g.15635 m.15635 type:complete len:312 (+) comp3297_c0_seq2:98-1033(+)
MPPPPPNDTDDSPHVAKRPKFDVVGEPPAHLEIDDLSYECTKTVSDYLERVTKHRPTLLIVCGSGLGHLADDLTDTQVIPYGDIPGFAVSTVSGHKGQLVFGLLRGKTVVAMQGRIHMYEGHPLWKATLPIRVLHNMGCTHMIVTNACGGINESYKVGDIMLMKDHINMPGLAGFNPLRGPNEDHFGPRFPAMNKAYCKDLRAIARESAKKVDLKIHEGVYAFVCGPSYETSAEIRMLNIMGADVVGMSTVPEVIVATHCGIRCIGLSLVTNVCIRDPESDIAPDHEEVKHTAELTAASVRSLVGQITESI